MKITYNKNPLATTIELDEHEKQLLWYKLKIEEMEHLMFGAHFNLTYQNKQDVDAAIKELDPDYYLDVDAKNGKSKLDTRIDDLLVFYLDELMQKHCGDCTCVPMSCSKCHAEDTLGINTIPGMFKQALYKIDNAFGKDGEKSIDEAIEALSNYDPKPQDPEGPGWKAVGGWESHLPRWKEEAAKSLVLLKDYRDTHFSKGE